MTHVWGVKPLLIRSGIHIRADVFQGEMTTRSLTSRDGSPKQPFPFLERIIT